MDLINIKLKTEYYLVKAEFNQVINDTKDKYKESQEKVINAEKSLNTINQTYNKTKKLYEDLNNPELLIPIDKKDNLKKKITKKLKLTRKSSLLENKKNNDNNIKKINDNNNDKLLNIIHENNNMTASTSPTIPINEINTNKNSFKTKSSKKGFKLNKKK